MKDEIEVKILEVDADALVQRLQQLGAQKTFEGTMRSAYFDDAQSAIRAQGKTLRLRTEGDHTILCLKIPKQNAHARIAEEHEIQVSDHDKAQLVLEQLGFRMFADDERERLIYRVGSSTVDITFYHNIPPFAEIESPSLEELQDAVEALGYRMQDTTKLTGGEVLAKYGRK